ncbi:LexA repressor, partial [human gut metagenome]
HRHKFVHEQQRCSASAADTKDTAMTQRSLSPSEEGMISSAPSVTEPQSVAEVLEGLDERAREVYEAVRQAVLSHGYPPSMREIGSQVGLTSP